ncbi:MAG: ribosomal L7Ae/L30e/S12e/Gadd45 family protein [Lachnospiraceae bacterium]|nr:ribosomal L7Ae/L30e/S12e/Gadd45 family protein [Lachnospiraceae bacterium]
MSKLYSYLGLCQKAGKLKSGTFQVEESVKDGSAVLVLFSNEASDNAKKQITNMCKYYCVRCEQIGTVDEISRAIGKECRKVCAITDENMAALVAGQLESL